ncbi:MAG: class I SAM-dependent methyltransferase [Spirochaetes bacterium]|nr:class I SAM-dependent methyltransferase [Spirochaetota bacterium]
MQKKLRDRGLLETNEVIKAGITGGTVLEIGPGPGYLGLEWLKKCPNSTLYWIEISETMGKLAESNAGKYNLEEKIKVTISDATKNFPFPDDFFDGVFTAGSLHEWTHPMNVINEIKRVLKVGGNFFIGDLKRNINPFIIFLMKKNLTKKVMKQGLKSSINAAYTKNEIVSLLKDSNLDNYKVIESPFGLSISGEKIK